MPAYADHVDAWMLEGCNILAESLRGVDVEISRVISYSFSNFNYRLQDSGFVICVHDAHEQRVWT